MRCPKCQGTDVTYTGKPGEVPGIGWYRCSSQTMTMVPQVPANPSAGMRPLYDWCAYQFLGPTAVGVGATATLCGCGRNAIGACRWCSAPLCQQHTHELDDSIGCAVCTSAEGIQAREDAERARRERELAQQRHAEQQRLQAQQQAAREAEAAAREAAERQAAEDERTRLLALPVMDTPALAALMMSQEQVSSHMGIEHTGMHRVPDLGGMELARVLAASPLQPKRVDPGGMPGSHPTRKIWLVGTTYRTTRSNGIERQTLTWLGLADDGTWVQVFRNDRGIRRPLWYSNGEGDRGISVKRLRQIPAIHARIGRIEMRPEAGDERYALSPTRRQQD